MSLPGSLAEGVEGDPVAWGSFVLPERPAIAGGALAGGRGGEGGGGEEFGVETDLAVRSDAGVEGGAFKSGPEFHRAGDVGRKDGSAAVGGNGFGLRRGPARGGAHQIFDFQ